MLEAFCAYLPDFALIRKLLEDFFDCSFYSSVPLVDRVKAESNDACILRNS